jgi:pilus assembly protein TadC
MARDVPGSVTNSVRVLGLIVATSGVITLLIWLLRDDVLLAWAKGNDGAQATLSEGGIEALRESPSAPGFVALAVVAFVGFFLLALVLGSFFVGGHPWTRFVLTATAGVGVLVGAICLANHLPVIFVVLSGVIIVEGLVLLFFLWQRSTTAYFRQF